MVIPIPSPWKSSDDMIQKWWSHLWWSLILNDDLRRRKLQHYVSRRWSRMMISDCDPPNDDRSQLVIIAKWQKIVYPLACTYFLSICSRFGNLVSLWLCLYCTYKLHVRISIVGASEQYTNCVSRKMHLAFLFSMCSIRANCQNSNRYQKH